MKMTELASLMGVTEIEAASFVACLRVWTDKGHSIDEAIRLHMAQMTRLVNGAEKVAVDPVIRTMAADMVWDEVNAA